MIREGLLLSAVKLSLVTLCGPPYASSGVHLSWADTYSCLEAGELILVELIRQQRLARSTLLDVHWIDYREGIVVQVWHTQQEVFQRKLPPDVRDDPIKGLSSTQESTLSRRPGNECTFPQTQQSGCRLDTNSRESPTATKQKSGRLS